MDDPSRFTSINEYYTFIYAISYMMLVELGIWIYNFKGWLKRPDKKNNDYTATWRSISSDIWRSTSIFISPLF